MLYAIVIMGAIAAYLALQWLITPLDRYLSVRAWRNAVRSGKRAAERQPRLGLKSRRTAARGSR